MVEEMGILAGQQALISIFVTLVVFVFTWWALQAVALEKLMKKGRTAQIRMLYILLTIAIGSLVSNFLLDYMNYAKSLGYLF